MHVDDTPGGRGAAWKGKESTERRQAPTWDTDGPAEGEAAPQPADPLGPCAALSPFSGAGTVSGAHGLTPPSRGTSFLPHALPATPGRLCFWERQSHRVGLYFQSKPGKHAEGKCDLVYDPFARHFPRVSLSHTALSCLLGAEAPVAPNARCAEVRGEGPRSWPAWEGGRGLDES